MATLETAKKSYERASKYMGANWKKGVTDKADVYAKEMASFLGLPRINPARKEKWSSGVADVTAEDFSKAVRGKADKWARRLREAFAP